MGFDSGFALMTLFSMLGGLGTLIGIVLLVIWAVRRSGGSPAEDAEVILRARYVRGEIDAAQLAEMARVLGPDERARRRDALGIVGLVVLVASVVLQMVPPLLFASSWFGTTGPCPPMI